MRVTAGIYATIALVQLLCGRFHDRENVHIFIPGFTIHYRLKFCVKEVLMHRCLPPFYPIAFFGLTAGIYAAKASRRLPGHLCERIYESENVQVFISSVSILYGPKFCVKEVLLHICLPSSHLYFYLYGLKGLFPL